MNACPAADAAGLSNLDLLYEAANASSDPEMFRAYFLRVLSAVLIDQPDLWATAVEMTSKRYLPVTADA